MSRTAPSLDDIIFEQFNVSQNVDSSQDVSWPKKDTSLNHRDAAEEFNELSKKEISPFHHEPFCVQQNLPKYDLPQLSSVASPQCTQPNTETQAQMKTEKISSLSCKLRQPHLDTLNNDSLDVLHSKEEKKSTLLPTIPQLHEGHRVNVCPAVTADTAVDVTNLTENQLVQCINVLATSMQKSIGDLVFSIDRLHHEVQNLAAQISDNTQTCAKEGNCACFAPGIRGSFQNSEKNAQITCAPQPPSYVPGEERQILKDMSPSLLNTSEYLAASSLEGSAAHRDSSMNSKNPFSNPNEIFSVPPLEEHRIQRVENSQRIAAERQSILEERRRRLQLEKRARQLMETISLHQDTGSSLFDDCPYSDNSIQTKSRLECKQHTVATNPLFE